YFVVFLLSTTLHEAAHAWVALRGGDPTAYRGGQVSLDPIPHIRREPFGMVVLPLLTAFATGWPIGYASAPYNTDWARRHPQRAALMALAGPAANFLLVIAAALTIRVGEASGIFYAPDRVTFGHVAATEAGGWWPGVAFMIGAFFSVNLLLGAFNLLPLPPLDGSGAMPLLLSRRATQTYQEFLWGNPAIGFLGLFVAWKVFDVVFDPLFFRAVNLLYPGVSYE
ncbi:MAG TPA: site-2 protease family protein, partial [Gemmatimonadaceae bacterium]|nr:site-2 protease family protein [Gemmatimonadaceae bacterium]